MADWYVYSGAGGTGTGANWTNAKTTLAATATASAAGDRIFVAHDHAESTAGAVTINFPGTAANPTLCYCVNRSGSVPPVAADLRTTATVSIGNSNNPILINGFCYVYGITFQGGTTTSGTNAHVGVAATSANKQKYVNCGFTLRTINAASFILLGGSASSGDAEFVGCSFTTGATSPTAICLVNGRALYRNCLFLWAAGMPGYLFQTRTAGYAHTIMIEGCDLSTFSNSIMNGGASSAGGGIIQVKDCKLNASVTPISNTATPSASSCDLIRSDSDNTNYKLGRTNHCGGITIDSSVYRTDGATDGATPHSWKLVTSANSTIAAPLEAWPLRIWNDTVTGTITLTIYGVSAAVPYNDELIFEAWTLSDASYPLAARVTSEMTPLDTHAALTTDSGSTWNGYTTAPFSCSLTLSPRQKGYIYVYVKAVKASTTYYIDPLPVLS